MSISEADLRLLARAPSLLAYAQRVGAEPRNFRKFTVASESSGYGLIRRTAATIKVSRGGSVECDNAEFAPTDVEKAAIESELANVELPKSVVPRNAYALRDLLPRDATLFEFRSEDGSGVLFVQQRVYDRDGNKSDLPWTMFCDGNWRCMEPDDLLPIWGLDQLNSSGKPVMIHEGAKTAHHLWRCTTGADISDAGGWLAEHPWAAELKECVHLGWPGGAPNPHRVDWGPIRRMAEGRRLVIVCDNDQRGVEAATAISRQLKRPMSAVLFDRRFPQGFDLADDWPSLPEWRRGNHYAGPSVTEMEKPATWATDVVHDGAKSGRPGFRVRQDFAREWLVVTQPPVYVHRRHTDRLLSESAFNHRIRPFSDVENTARLLARYSSSQVDEVAYMPDQVGGEVVRGSTRMLNTYRPSTIRPYQGDATPWLSFMNQLIPSQTDRMELMRWCATLIARPAVRMTYGVLLISETQGVGKSTLGESILVPLLGEWNASFPTEHMIVDATFNEWVAHRRLAVVHEIYSGHSRKAYDRLKSVITDGKVTVNRKFVEPYTLDNWLHIFACSNSLRALHLDDEDRRWLVPQVTDQIREPEYWRGLHAWLRSGGLRIIRWWADEFLAQVGPVETGAHAPSSTLKDEVIAESRSTGARRAYEIARILIATGERCVVSIEDVRQLIAAERGFSNVSHQHMESALTIRKAMKAAGMKDALGEDGRPKRRTIKTGEGANAQAHSTYVMANFEIGSRATWSDLKPHFKTSGDLYRMEFDHATAQDAPTTSIVL